MPPVKVEIIYIDVTPATPTLHLSAKQAISNGTMLKTTTGTSQQKPTSMDPVGMTEETVVPTIHAQTVDIAATMEELGAMHATITSTGMITGGNAIVISL